MGKYNQETPRLFKEQEGSLMCSQESATGHYPEPTEFSSQTLQQILYNCIVPQAIIQATCQHKTNSQSESTQ